MPVSLAMPDQPIYTDLKGLLIYEGDEVVFDGDNLSDYAVICDTVEDLLRALGGADDGITITGDADPGL